MTEQNSFSFDLKVSFYSFAFVLCAFLVCIWGGRWTDASKGFPSSGPDYGSLIVITHDIEAGRYFPSLVFSEVGAHSINKNLPIYHGIWGAPLLTILFEKTFSIPTPQAMLIIGDIAVLLSLVIFLQILLSHGIGPYGLLALMTLFAINILFMIIWGHYQNLLAVFWGLALWRWKSLIPAWWRFSLVLIASVTYPDSFLVLTPLLLSSRSTSRSSRVLQLIAVTVVYIGLIAILLSRFHLQASIDLNWWAYGLGLCLICFTILRGRASAISAFSWNYFGITILLIGTSLAMNGQIVYYATKIIYWAPLLVVDLLACQQAIDKKRIEQLLLIAASLAIIWYAPDLSATMKPLFTASSPYTGSDEKNAHTLLNENSSCPDGILIPLFTDERWSSDHFVKTIAMASLTGRMNINTGKINLDDFGIPHIPMQELDQHLSEAVLNLGYKKDGSGNLRFYCPHP